MKGFGKVQRENRKIVKESLNSTAFKWDLKSLLSIICGNAVVAFAVAAFILPNAFPMAGVTGIALLLEKLFRLPVTLTVLVLNLLFLALSYFALGKSFFFSTVLSSLLYPLFFSAAGMLPFSPLRESLTGVLFGGAALGVGIGLVIRAGASTGGMDIPQLILCRYTGISMATAVLLLDAGILALMLVSYSLEELLYGILLVAIQAVVLERVLVFGYGKMQIMVVTNSDIDVSRAIITECHRGVTLLDSVSGYEGRKGKVVFSVLTARELALAKRVILAKDPEAFMVIQGVQEVHGNFSP